MALLEVEHVSKRFGGVRAVADVSFGVEAGRVTGLIGGNGAGKTTLFHLIGGFLSCDAGTIRFDGQRIDHWPPHRVAGLGIGRTFQDLKLFRRLSVLDNVLLALPDEPAERFARALLGRRPAAARAARRARALALLAPLELAGQAHEPADRLSYGDQKLLAIARVLATDARLVMHDEPVAGLPEPMIERILGVIRRVVAAGRTVLLVDHNVEAVMSVADRVVALDHGRLIAAGPPAAVRADPTVVATYLGGVR
jgi:ABC-type branched-subunit amino acid transport system ATPase component